MRFRDFIRELKKLVTEFWIEVAVFVILVAIVFELIKRLFIWFA